MSKNKGLIVSYFEDIWIDLDVFDYKKFDYFCITEPFIEKKLDLSNSKIYKTFDVKRVTVKHKMLHALKFYLYLPYLLFSYKTFMFVCPPYFHAFAQPLMMLLNKNVSMRFLDAYCH